MISKLVFYAQSTAVSDSENVRAHRSHSLIKRRKGPWIFFFFFFNETIKICSYIYIYMCVCVCVCNSILLFIVVVHFVLFIRHY